MRCPPCKGSGVEPGTKTIVCKLCNGSGQLSDDRLENPPCAFCEGSGISRGTSTVRCPVCQRWGRLPDRGDSSTPGMGKAHVATLSALRQALPKIATQHARDFVAEGIGCAEAKFHRAAVVLTWVGAIRVLYDYVVANNLPAFNAEATRRDPKWRAAKTAEDLSRMKEHEFLQVLEAISVIGKGVKAELEGCLKLRNSCCHPNSLQVSENRTAAHIETLILNVFSVFT